MTPASVAEARALLARLGAPPRLLRHVELLLRHGVTPALARICVSHARWDQMPVCTEELLVALADKLWKGVRRRSLEERVIDALATLAGSDRWASFVELDTLFEHIAADGPLRLERSA